MAVLPSRNPIPGSPTGMAKQTIPGGGGATTQANVPMTGRSTLGYNPGLLGGLGVNMSRIGSVGKDPKQQITTPTADMSLPTHDSSAESYVTQLGGSQDASSPHSPAQTGTSNGSRDSLTALRGLAGLAGGGSGNGGMMAGGLSAGGAASIAGIGAPDLGNTPVDSAAPVAPDQAASMPPDMAGGQYLSGPGAERPGLGQRVPPSLAALLKPRVY